MVYFNPRTPCGVRLAGLPSRRCMPLFQSTHPLRGATSLSEYVPTPSIFQSTHPLRGATASMRSTSISPINFNPRTPCGVRLMNERVNITLEGFQSTHPLRGATRRSGGDRVLPLISIHAPLAGCDLQARQGLPAFRDFNPRTPCGVRPLRAHRLGVAMEFQSTHPLRGATCGDQKVCAGRRISIHAPLAGCDWQSRVKVMSSRNFNPRTPCGVRLGTGAVRVLLLLRISIHAPLAGCDRRNLRTPSREHISIHAPLAGCDSSGVRSTQNIFNFNPRTPCGVRLLVVHSLGLVVDFNPRTPCGVRPFCSLSTKRRSKISIHAPLAGCDHIRRCMAMETVISIHAPLAGCDLGRFDNRLFLYISIHAPLAGCDTVKLFSVRTLSTFQSTHPLRGATGIQASAHYCLDISIHAPLAGCDSNGTAQITTYTHFNPRTPCGVRPEINGLELSDAEFQSTHPLRGATSGTWHPV